MDTSQVTQTVLLCLVTFFMSLRIFTRWHLMKVFRPDDLLGIIAWAIYIARAIVFYVFLDTNSWVDDAQKTVLANWLMILLYTAGTCVIKLSFSVTLYRIVGNKSLARAVLLLAITAAIITIFEFSWTLFLCRPMSKLWTGAAGSCHKATTWGISLLVHGSVLLIVDLALGLIIPVFLLRKLQMRTALKISVGLTIAIGSLASIATVVRLVYTYLLFTTPEAEQNLHIWMDIEFGVNIICTAAITLRPLLRRTGLLSTSRSRTHSIAIHRECGMRIQAEEEVAVQAEAIILEERTVSKV